MPQLDRAAIAQDLRKLTTGEVLVEGAPLREASADFGRLVQRTPLVVVRPKCAAEVAEILRYAAFAGLPVVTQGGLHSQSGQALTEGGIALDLKRHFTSIGPLDEENSLITVGAGTLWRSVVEHTYPKGLVPPVLTNNLNVTVGGTLSMGGLGVASWRCGAQGDQVEALEVVTGSGEHLWCSPHSHPELFWGMFTTLGQFGVILSATLRLRPVQANTRTYYLLYDDLHAAHRDLRLVMEEQRCDAIEGFCSPCLQGLKLVNGMKQGFAEWFFPVQLTVEYGDRAPDSAAVLEGLKPYRFVHVQDQPTLDYLQRMDPVFAIWQMMGTWEFAHPWMETILPWDASPEFIAETLRDFPPGTLMGGHVLLWPCRSSVSRLPFFMHPASDLVMGFGLLPAVPPHLAGLALGRLDAASRESVLRGGKRYLSGLIEFSKADWRAHYGPAWSSMVALKRQYDPKGVLNPHFPPLSAELDA